jgi:hypothetical protein
LRVVYDVGTCLLEGFGHQSDNWALRVLRVKLDSADSPHQEGLGAVLVQWRDSLG